MTEWEVISTKILSTIDKMETKTEKETIIKTAVYVFLYKALENEETFNDAIEQTREKAKVKKYER